MIVRSQGCVKPGSKFHDHAVVSEGAFTVEGGVLRFYPAPAPSTKELEELTERLRRRILRRMKGAVPEAAILDMLAWPHSGFSLNASVRIEAHDRTALGRLLRYVLRPALSLQKLSYDAEQSLVRYRPGKAGLPSVPTWSPLEFMERFAAIIPPPRKHLVRYYGALGPRSRLRRALTAGAKASGEGCGGAMELYLRQAAALGSTSWVRTSPAAATYTIFWPSCADEAPR